MPFWHPESPVGVREKVAVTVYPSGAVMSVEHIMKFWYSPRRFVIHGVPDVVIGLVATLTAVAGDVGRLLPAV